MYSRSLSLVVSLLNEVKILQYVLALKNEASQVRVNKALNKRDKNKDFALGTQSRLSFAFLWDGG